MCSIQRRRRVEEIKSRMVAANLCTLAKLTYQSRDLINHMQGELDHV
jgi:hypothetical protein